MVDTADLKSAERKFMGVRLSPEAQEMVAVAQLARALGCGPRSRGFKSRQLPKIKALLLQLSIKRLTNPTIVCLKK